MKGFTQVSRIVHKEEVFDPLSMLISTPSVDTNVVMKESNDSMKSSFSDESSSFVENDTWITADSTKFKGVSLENDEPLPSSNQSNNVSGLRDSGSMKWESVSPKQEKDSPVESESLQLLSGEIKLITMVDSVLQAFPVGTLNGQLHVTNYRILFVPQPSILKSLSENFKSIHSWLQIPLACIDKLERDKKPKDSMSSPLMISIFCKDCRNIKLFLRSSTSTNGDYDLERAFNLISAYAFPNNIRHLFAFSHNFPLPTTGSDVLGEFTRLGVMEFKNLRISTANRDYRLCHTYPETLIMPVGISDDDLFAVANFRAGHRLPSMSWISKYTGGSLWRSSQPKSGVSGSCAQDERLLELIAKIGSGYGSDSTLYIVDCRSRASAMANRAAGAGYESQTNYPSSRLDFYNIPNIHGVRDSHKNITSIMLNASVNPSSDVSFSKQIEDSQWLTNIRLILKSSWDTASFLLKGSSVLVHCSHGWDRTSQVCALAQLLLDPYYRTIEGFGVLIEKEWCSFGHPFQMRCGHGHDKSTRSEDEISQVYLQFLDCVWQIHRQFLPFFEFNARYILAIADGIYSCRFGNFICSCESDKKLYKIKQSTSDLWTYLKANKQLFTNHLFSNGTTSEVLLPPLGQLLRNVSLWSDYFCRWSTVQSLSVLPETLEKFLPSSSSTNADLKVAPSSTSSDFWECIWRKENLKAKFNEEKVNKVMNIIQGFVADMELLMQPKFDDDEIQKFSTLKSSLFQSIMFDDIDELISSEIQNADRSANIESIAPTVDTSLVIPLQSSSIAEDDYSQFLV